ncbi:hypothetical protein BD626DRAFT_629479 [Schizophyllum amplum]|uniref:Uncharacterized protein n=1 Tax=Schizophyllum amplum TaxID=97359 RepID=A0A550CIJ8_9AGAR|nr:hypothetical protein BD626DRAFT_629479 [Auriculariopsis ampla]
MLTRTRKPPAYHTLQTSLSANGAEVTRPMLLDPHQSDVRRRKNSVADRFKARVKRAFTIDRSLHNENTIPHAPLTINVATTQHTTSSPHYGNNLTFHATPFLGQGLDAGSENGDEREWRPLSGVTVVDGSAAKTSAADWIPGPAGQDQMTTCPSTNDHATSGVRRDIAAELRADDTNGALLGSCIGRSFPTDHASNISIIESELTPPTEYDRPPAAHLTGAIRWDVPDTEIARLAAVLKTRTNSLSASIPEYTILVHIGIEDLSDYTDIFGHSDLCLEDARSKFHRACRNLGDQVTGVHIIVEKPIQGVGDAAAWFIEEGVAFGHLQNCRSIDVQYRGNAGPWHRQPPLRAKTPNALPHLEALAISGACIPRTFLVYPLAQVRVLEIGMPICERDLTTLALLCGELDVLQARNVFPSRFYSDGEPIGMFLFTPRSNEIVFPAVSSRSANLQSTIGSTQAIMMVYLGDFESLHRITSRAPNTFSTEFGAHLARRDASQCRQLQMK